MLGKQKGELLGFEFGSWLGGNLSDGGIQIVGSLWAKKNSTLRPDKHALQPLLNKWTSFSIMQ